MELRVHPSLFNKQATLCRPCSNVEFLWGVRQRRGMTFIVSVEKQNLFSITALVNNLILLLISDNI